MSPGKGEHMLQNTSDTKLIDEVKNLVQQERSTSRALIERFAEVDRRQLYLQFGYGSLFEWLTKDLKYSSSAAFRRVEAARLLQRVPSVAERLETGAINLTTLARIQTLARQEEKRTGTRVTDQQRHDLLLKIENKASAQAESILLQELPLAAKTQEQIRPLDADLSRLSVTFKGEQLQKLKRVRQLLSHKDPRSNFADIIEYLCNEYLDRKDPLRKVSSRLRMVGPGIAADRRRSERQNLCPSRLQNKNELDSMTQPVAAAAMNESRIRRTAIPAAIRRFVIQRDEGKCTFTHAKTGRVCGSRYQVEVDHRKPVACGGDNSVENLRCLCRKHNLHAAIQVFGRDKIKRYKLRN